jgi:metal-responsive CopG/Arc/MetJ family transcriptional regulator
LKTLKISDDIHSKLTSLLGELMAQTSKMQTYQDAINALIKESVMLPPELIAQTENFIEENRQMGFTTKEEFVRDAIRRSLNLLRSGNECIEIPRDQYEELNEAVREMDMPFRSAEQFVNDQIDAVLEKYKEYKKNTNAR